jgi:hypothetical protein
VHGNVTQRFHSPSLEAVSRSADQEFFRHLLITSLYYLTRIEGFVGLLKQSNMCRLKCIDITGRRVVYCEDGGSMSPRNQWTRLHIPEDLNLFTTLMRCMNHQSNDTGEDGSTGREMLLTLFYQKSHIYSPGKDLGNFRWEAGMRVEHFSIYYCSQQSPTQALSWEMFPGHYVIPCLIRYSKAKAIPLQAWTGPEGSSRLRLPDFKTVGTWRW